MDSAFDFRDLLFRRGEPRFVAFDLLWCEGEDLRYLPLVDRKQRLRSIVRNGGDRRFYCDHVEHAGERLFRLACEHDLEGVVAKRKSDPYLLEHASWLKTRNRDYSQWAGREELFERERGTILISKFGMAALWRVTAPGCDPEDCQLTTRTADPESRQAPRARNILRSPQS